MAYRNLPAAYYPPREMTTLFAHVATKLAHHHHWHRRRLHWSLLDGLIKDLTGDYQRGLLTLTIPGLAAAAIMLSVRGTAQRRKS